jgi:hypothetical protein
MSGLHASTVILLFKLMGEDMSATNRLESPALPSLCLLGCSLTPPSSNLSGGMDLDLRLAFELSLLSDPLRDANSKLFIWAAIEIGREDDL